MKRVLAVVGLALLTVVGLFMGVVLAGVVAGYASATRSSAPAASGVTLIRYVECDPAHPTPHCPKPPASASSAQ